MAYPCYYASAALQLILGNVHLFDCRSRIRSNQFSFLVRPSSISASRASYATALKLTTHRKRSNSTSKLYSSRVVERDSVRPPYRIMPAHLSTVMVVDDDGAACGICSWFLGEIQRVEKRAQLGEHGSLQQPTCCPAVKETRRCEAGCKQMF